MSLIGVWESLQELPFEAKAALVIPAVITFGLWAALEIRHERRHRQDQVRIKRLDDASLREKRAILQIVRAAGINRGASITLGTVVHEGSASGQHFSGAVKNAGPHMAEAIQVTASLGDLKARIDEAPSILPPHSAPELLDIVLPFGAATYSDVMGTIKAGQPLRVHVEFEDGTDAAAPIEQCFVFRLEHIDDSSTGWISRSVSCNQ